MTKEKREKNNLPEILDGLSDQGRAEELREYLMRHACDPEASISEQAKATGKKVQKLIAPEGKLPPVQESLFKWAGFPTDMTRVSPFFPMNAKDLKDRPFLKDLVITAAAWGEITFSGPKLSTYEEDALLAVLLACLELVSKHRIETTSEDGRKTYTYQGPALLLLQLLGYARPSSKDYKRLINSLKLLTVAGVDIKIPGSKKSSKDPRFTSMSAMLSNVTWDNDNKFLSVTINPFFYETYLEGTVTLMDITKRMSLSGSVSKALYRFVQSHRDNPVFSGHFLTLSQVLNMDTQQPAKKLRELIRAAIRELIKKDVLSKGSKFINKDIVQLHRSGNTFPKATKTKALEK